MSPRDQRGGGRLAERTTARDGFIHSHRNGFAVAALAR